MDADHSMHRSVDGIAASRSKF